MLVLRIVSFFFCMITSVVFASSEHDQTICSSIKKPIFYQVEPGDNLSDIARAFNLNLWGDSQDLFKITQLNKLENPESIVAGQLIQLPFDCEEQVERYDLVIFEEYRQVNPRVFKVKSIKGPSGDLTYVQFLTRAKTKSDLNPEKTTEPSSKVVPTSSSNTQPIKASKDQLAIGDPIPLLDFESRIGFSLLTGFKRIDSKDTTTQEDSIIISEPSVGFGLDYVQKWSESFSSSFYFNRQSVTMRTSSLGELKNPKQSLMDFGIGFHYRILKKTLFSFRGFYGETLFARGIQSSVVNLDKVFQSGVAAQVRQNIFVLKKSGLDIIIGLRSMLATEIEDYKLSRGTGYFVGPSYSKVFDHTELEIKILYSSNNQNSNRFNQTEKNIDTSVRFIWEL